MTRPHTPQTLQSLPLLGQEGALGIGSSPPPTPHSSSNSPRILVPERWDHRGHREYQTLKINTSVGELRVGWSASVQPSGSQRAECALQPALASADENSSCLVVAHSLISGCNRIQGQMLRAPGRREDRCPSSRRLPTEGFAHTNTQTFICTHQSHLEMLRVSLRSLELANCILSA